MQFERDTVFNSMEEARKLLFSILFSSLGRKTRRSIKVVIICFLVTTASYHLSQKVSSLRYWYSPILQSQLGISISLTENKTKSDLNEIELYFFLTLSESY